MDERGLVRRGVPRRPPRVRHRRRGGARHDRAGRAAALVGGVAGARGIRDVVRQAELPGPGARGPSRRRVRHPGSRPGSSRSWPPIPRGTCCSPPISGRRSPTSGAPATSPPGAAWSRSRLPCSAASSPPASRRR
ncbi:hypothetical protein G5V59_27205 [Nocardioides sp. W3-2-3]|uniref:hypothetical protein n=1 Tax=Nocardioides convexus TaxID=2712224 RepID=UPI0024182705|nr:hypothetical protein [Nocardioides convexus]NHA02078.1 hypothetical protein [Nocardioides convexus]